MPPPRSWLAQHRPLAALCLTLALAAIAALYWQGLNGPFLLDDSYNIPQTRVETWDAATLQRLAAGNASGPLGRPLALFTFTLNHLVGGSAPYGFKLVNLGVHLLTGLALFALGGLLLAQLSRMDPRRAWLAAGIAAGLWALHPLQVGTVLYAVQRMTLLAGLFDVAALLCYAVCRLRLLRGEHRIGWPAAGLALASLLAILSKESGALVVFYLLVLETVVFRFAVAQTAHRRHLIVLLGLFSLLPIALALLYLGLRLDTLLAPYQTRAFSLGERLLTQPGVIWFYLRLILLPDATRMSLFHDDYPVADWNLLTALQVASVPALLVAAWLLRRRLPVASLGILWFFAAHLMESTFLPLELVFEHRNYLALWGVLLPLAWWLTPRHLRGSGQRLRLAALVLVGAAMALQTHTRAHTWSDGALLAAVAAHEHPTSPRARETYAGSLSQQGRHAEALQELRAAERLAPDKPGGTLAVLAGECALGRASADTLQRAQRKLARHALDTYSASLLHGLMRRAERGDCDGFRLSEMVALAQATADYSAGESHGLRRAAGFSFLGMAQSRIPALQEPALAAFAEAHAATPDDLIILFKIARLQANLGRFDEASANLARLRRLARDSADDQSFNLRMLARHIERQRSVHAAQ